MNSSLRVSAKRASTDMGRSWQDAVPSKRMMLERSSSSAASSQASPSEPVSPVSPESPATSLQSPSPNNGSISEGSQSEEENATKGKPSVRIPDLFSSFMAVDPVINVNYDKVKPEADAWVAEVFQLSEAKAKRNAKANFTIMNSIWAPYADAEALRMMVDWHNWVFAFDDQFDEGHLKDDPVQAQKELDAHWDILEDKSQPIQSRSNPIRYVFQTTWDRFKKRSSLELQARWKAAHKSYFAGLIGQVKVQASQSALSLTVEEYMDFRRATIGTDPSFVLVEYAHGINIPQEQVDHETMKVCQRASADLVILVNDLLSYRKDLEQGVDHNLITLLRAQGLTRQEAVDRIGEMLIECYRSWYSARARMPLWGQKVDKEVSKYLEGCRNIAIGNLHWSYKTGRYLGPDGDRVRETRIMTLPF